MQCTKVAISMLQCEKSVDDDMPQMEGR
jgi:hypothetical protein